MSDLDIKITKVYGGPFFWDNDDLHAHAAQFDMHYIGHYSPKDPRTWLLVRDIKLENGKDYLKSTTPPPFVAYDVALMADLVMHKPMSRITQNFERLGNDRYARRFLLYPFNFCRQDLLRKTEHILYDEFRVWMRLWGSDPDTPTISTSGPTSSTIGTVSLAETEQGATGSPYDQIMKALSGTDIPSQAAPAKLQAELKATQSKLQDSQKQLSDTKTPRVAEAAAAKKLIDRASAAEKKAKESRSIAAKLKQQENLLRESRESERKAVADCSSLKKEVEASAVEVINLGARLAQSQAALETVQDKLTITEQEHAHTKRQLEKASGQVTERDQQMRNILAELTRRKASDDANMPSAKRVMTEDEATHKEALAKFERQKRHYDELRAQNGGRLSFRHDVEWMRVQGAEYTRLKKRMQVVQEAKKAK